MCIDLYTVMAQNFKRGFYWLISVGKKQYSVLCFFIGCYIIAGLSKSLKSTNGVLERDLFCAVDGSLGCVWYEYLDCQRRNEYQETKAKERKKKRI